jgi:hypothetical protein
MRIGSFEKKRMLTITFLGLGFIIFNAVIAFGGADKSPSVNLFGHSTPDWSETTSVWFTFWDEHIDWQTSGKEWYYPHATRNQPVGTYELIQCWLSNRIPWLFAFFDSSGVHRDSGIAHVKVNSYYYPNTEASSSSRFIPGWDPVNDANNNWARDKKADFEYNNGQVTNFTVNYTSNYIEDASGGQMGVWIANEWRRDYVKMGWSGNVDTVSFRVDSNTTSRIYLNAAIPSHTYNWFIVDDSSAVNHNAVAMTDSLARVHPQRWTDVLMNVKHWLTRAFAGRFFHKVIHTDLQGREPTDIYPDDVLKTNPSWSCGSGWCDNWIMGGTCLEGLDNDDIYRPAVRGYLRQLNDSLGSNNFLLVNVYEVNVGWDTIVRGSVDGLWHEFWMSSDEIRGNFNTKFNTIKKYKLSPYNIKLHFLHASGANPIGDLNRSKINILSQYYIQKEDSIYLLYDTEPAYGIALGDTTRWWYGLMGIDLGSPTDTAEEVLESGQYVWKRPFSNGYVIWKPRPGSSSNYTDVTVHSLPKYYYRLDINGNVVGDSVIQVSLRNAEGVILLSTGGGSQSQIYPPQPLSPQNGATVDTTQPTLIIQNTRDPEDRPLLYYFELDYNTQFDSQLKKESTPFELETGQDSTTKWTVPTQLSSGVYYWRSRAYTNTYPSDTSQTSTVYHFQLSTGIGDSLYALYLFSPVGDDLVTSLRPTLNAQFIHNGFDRERIRTKFEISEEASFSTGRTIISPYVNIPEDLVIFWTTNWDLKEGKRYFWRVNVYDLDLLVAISDPGSFFTGSIHVFPNPFKPSQGDSFITFRNIPLNSKIIITTLSGELIRELSGNTSTDVVWDVKNQRGGSLASGAYYYRVDFPSGSTSGKLAIIK